MGSTTAGRIGASKRAWIARCLVVAMAVVSATAAFAQEAKGPAVSADISVASKYVWRGLILTNDPVLQPSLTVAYKGLDMNIWANTDLTDVNGTPGEVNEFDYTLSYSFSFKNVNASVGVIQYTFPHTAFEPTTEITASAGLDVPLSPTVTLYYDVDQVGGIYGTVGVSHSLPLGVVYRGISPSLDLSGSIGYASDNWNEGYYGVKTSGFVDLLLTATLSVPVDDHLSVAPFVSFSQVLDGGLKDAVQHDNATYFGATLSYAF